MSLPAKRRPTIRDVAAAAGVSHGTVSRVINGGHWVSPESLAAVEEAIRDIGYRINPHARSLATRRSNSVAFLLTEPQQLLFEDPNFSVLLRSVTHELTARKISLLLMVAGTASEREQATEFLTGGYVDGVLLMSYRSSPLFSSLVKAGVPVIACGRPIGFEGKIGYVQADDRSGAVDIVRYLRESGRRRIATITGPLDSSGGISRFEGYREVLGAEFDETRVVTGDYTTQGGMRAMRELLEVAPDLDAVFAGNDAMASGAIQVLLSAGRRVPEDVAVAGFDDSGFARNSRPAITTMRQPFERISAEMVRLLRQAIEGEGAAAVTIPTELVIREST